MKHAAVIVSLALILLPGPARTDPVISDDARIVTFTYEPSGFAPKIFRYDRHSGEMTRLDPCGGEAEWLEPWLFDAVMTADGRFTAYSSDNTIYAKPDLCLRDEHTAQIQAIATIAFEPALSIDGRLIAYTQNNFEFFEVLLWDALTNTTSQACLDSLGNPGEPVIEGYAEKVPFCTTPAISADGRFVAFRSEAANFAPNDTNGVYDVFVRDLRSGRTIRVSQSTRGVPANAQSGGTAISADGRYVAFESLASNLVRGDTNGVYDIFVHDRKRGSTERVSVSSRAGEANGPSFDPQFSADGRFVVFSSAASNLVHNDTNGVDGRLSVRTKISAESVSFRTQRWPHNLRQFSRSR